MRLKQETGIRWTRRTFTKQRSRDLARYYAKRATIAENWAIKPGQSKHTREKSAREAADYRKRIEELHREEDELPRTTWVLRRRESKGARGWLDTKVRLSADEMKALRARQRKEPVKIITLGNGADRRVAWWYGGGLYSTKDTKLRGSDVKALVDAADERRKQTLERAHAVSAMRESLDAAGKRQAIPREIKVAVWQRDGGRCVECGSQAELEFDHVIPLVLGGANTERNLQVLCAVCNRSKGAALG